MYRLSRLKNCQPVGDAGGEVKGAVICWLMRAP
jgi:hypothetical protein